MPNEIENPVTEKVEEKVIEETAKPEAIAEKEAAPAAPATTTASAVPTAPTATAAPVAPTATAAPVAPAATATPTAPSSTAPTGTGTGHHPPQKRGHYNSYNDNDDMEGGGRFDKKKFFYAKKVCKFCTGQFSEANIDYKNIELLRRYVMPSGKIVPRRINGNCAKHQRRVVTEVKKARIMALLPFLDR